MAIDDIEDWVARACSAAQRVVNGFEERMGYEPGAQEINLVQDGSAGDLTLLPEDARQFFAYVDELSWPDVWNGYFLGPTSDVLRGVRAKDPGTVAVGASEHRCVSIGSDGGGGYFVLDLDDQCAVLLVSGAAVSEGVLTGTPRMVASDLDAFLEALINNAQLVANGQTPAF